MGFFSNLFGNKEVEANTAEPVQPVETSMGENEEAGSSIPESADSSVDMGGSQPSDEQEAVPAESTETAEEETQQ